MLQLMLCRQAHSALQLNTSSCIFRLQAVICCPCVQVYQAIARALGCLTLFFFANLLKTLAAKIMATSFHTEAHFQKMQEALQKVFPP